MKWTLNTPEVNFVTIVYLARPWVDDIKTNLSKDVTNRTQADDGYSTTIVLGLTFRSDETLNQ